jgi:hypothetical protein
MESINKYSYMQTNAVAVAGAEIVTRHGTRYRVFVGWSDVGNPHFEPTLVWVPFKMVQKPWGEDGERVPCFTREEEARFPKTVSTAAHELWLAVKGRVQIPQPELF